MPAWSTSHQQGTIGHVHIDLVRGDVEVVRRPGDVRIDAWKVAGARSDVAVRIRERRSGNVLRVFDAYPLPPTGRPEECQPPPGERGAFWNSDSAMSIVVSVPDGVEVSNYVMAGAESR